MRIAGRNRIGLLAGAGVTLAAAAWAQEGPTVPVSVGFEPGMDACPAVGMIRDMDGGPDAPVAVRGAPGLAWQVIDEVQPGQMVAMCDGRDGWLGIVYFPGDMDSTADCGTGGTITPPQPYAGPCRSGWVQGEHVILVAG